MPFPSQAPHFACCIPLPLQRWHSEELLAPMCPFPLQLEQVCRMDPVPLQVPHEGIIAVFYIPTAVRCCADFLYLKMDWDVYVRNPVEVTESKMEYTLTEYVTWQERKGFKWRLCWLENGIFGIALIKCSSLRWIESHGAKVDGIREGVGALCIMNVGW